MITSQNKHKCYKCNNMAVWYYMPSTSLNKDNDYYCDNCISRGCSCNAFIDFDEIIDNDAIVDFDKNTEDVKYNKDQFGRDLPCVEYDYCETGFDEDE